MTVKRTDVIVAMLCEQAVLDKQADLRRLWSVASFLGAR
jgi:hypothetical protein